MKIDVTDLSEEIIYNARQGRQNMKVVEVIEKLDDARQEFLAIRFVNQWGEYHIEKFYPDKHARKLYELARVIGDECFERDEDGNTIINTKELVGGYFNCVLTNVETTTGEVTDTVYIRDIRSNPRRKDTTGSWSYKKSRRKRGNNEQ